MTRRVRPASRVLIAILIILIVWWFNTFTLKTTGVTIRDSKIKDDITFVQLTDLHGATFGRNNSALLSAIDNAKPDFVTVTGDMFTSGSKSGQKTAVDLISSIAEKYDTYVVNGEHDNNDQYFDEIIKAGATLLDYRTADIEIGNTRLCIYGIDNVYYSNTFDLSNEFSLDPDKYNILLAHIENFKAFVSFGVDLSICGDTHGGQIRLPFIGALNNRGVWFPELSDNDAKYVHGLFESGKSKLYVSSGLGNYPVPVRFMNRPELVVFRLEPAQ